MYASLTNRIRRGHSPPACTLSYRRFLLFARKGNLAGPTGNGKSLERVHTPRPATTQPVVVKRFEGFVPGIWRGAGTPLRLLACIAVASCGGGQSPPVGHTVPAGICDTIQNSYTCAQTIERVQLAGYRRAERRGSDLVLALSNGDSIVLTDVVGGADSTIRYSYRVPSTPPTAITSSTPSSTRALPSSSFTTGPAELSSCPRFQSRHQAVAASPSRHAASYRITAPTPSRSGAFPKTAPRRSGGFIQRANRIPTNSIRSCGVPATRGG